MKIVMLGSDPVNLLSEFCFADCGNELVFVDKGLGWRDRLRTNAVQIFKRDFEILNNRKVEFSTLTSRAKIPEIELCP